LLTQEDEGVVDWLYKGFLVWRGWHC